jgi:hypothetical protein
VNLILFRGSNRRKAVDFVEKDDRRLASTGFVEEQPELALGLANPF